VLTGEQIDGQHRFWAAKGRSTVSGWPLAVWIVSIVTLLGAVLITITAVPPSSRWDGAVVLGTCGGLPLLQLKDGSTWLRVDSVRFYRVEDPSKLTCG
jgi:hypothetical protein